MFPNFTSLSTRCASLLLKIVVMSSEDFLHILQEITDDRFLKFIEQFTASYIILPGMIAEEEPKRLDWCIEGEYTQRHHEAFLVYRSIYESRLNSLLRKRGVSQEQFVRQCSQVLEEPPPPMVKLDPVMFVKRFWRLCTVSASLSSLLS